MPFFAMKLVASLALGTALVARKLRRRAAPPPAPPAPALARELPIGQGLPVPQAQQGIDAGDGMEPCEAQVELVPERQWTQPTLEATCALKSWKIEGFASVEKYRSGGYRVRATGEMTALVSQGEDYWEIHNNTVNIPPAPKTFVIVGGGGCLDLFPLALLGHLAQSNISETKFQSVVDICCQWARGFDFPIHIISPR